MSRRYAALIQRVERIITQNEDEVHAFNYVRDYSERYLLDDEEVRYRFIVLLPHPSQREPSRPRDEAVH
jgi:hypothetical protein